MQDAPLLHVDRLGKRYVRGWPRREVTFSLDADFEIREPCIVGVLGPNGSGKTTLFELITGSNLPTAGRVLVEGRDIHQVRTRERDRLAVHYHQSYQVRHFQRRKPDFLLQPAGSDSPRVHLFDEPQFNTQDGYIGFMLDFFAALRGAGKVVFLCLHPQERYHVDILRGQCDRYLFVHRGTVSAAAGWDDLLRDERVRGYLGNLAEEAAPD